MATPNITREIFDGNLERSTQVGITNRRVVLIGTASDGPMYTPVRVSSPGDAEDVFGSISDGTLVRGIKECLDAQAGSSAAPFVAGMRVGGLFAQRASTTVQDDSSPAVDCLYIEAVDEGTVYNDIHIRFQADTGTIFVYNPKTALYRTWSYNFSPTLTDSSDIKSLDELADAINGDASLSQIMYAAVYDNLVHAQFLIQAAAAENSLLNSEADGSSVIDFGNVENADLHAGDLQVEAGTPNITETGSGVGAGLGSYFRDVPAGNLYSIYASSVFQNLEGETTKEITTGQLFNENNAPADGIKSILNISGYQGTTAGVVDDSDEAQGYLKVVQKECTVALNANGDSTGEIYSTGTTIGTAASDTLHYRYPATYGIDSDGWANATAIVDYAASGDAGTPAASEDAMSWNVDPDKVVMKIEYTVDGENWVDAESFASGAANVLTWVYDSALAQGFIQGEIGTGNLSFAADGDVISIRVTFNSGPIVLSKKGSVVGLAAATDYYPQGNNLIFGGSFPEIFAFRYAQINYYQEGVSYDVLDNNPLKIKVYENFYGDGAAVQDYADDPAIFGIEMRYYGDVSDLSGFNYLTGGSNGNDLTNAQLYEELDECYNHLVVDFFDIIVLMGCSWDSKKVSPNSSGVLTEMSAGFHQQLSTFLNAFNGEMIGVMGFEPLIGKGIGGRIQRQDVADRVADITETTGWAYANIASFHQPWMYAIDIEGVFAAGGVKYGANVAAATAGLIAGMPVEEAIYRFTIPGVQGMVYRYSEVDRASGKTQIDRLSDARIATGSSEVGGVRITESRTMSRAGGDFENLMTILALQQVLDICRNVARGYMGKVTSDALLSALQSELNSGIGDALVPKALRGFKAPVAMTPGERVVGKLTIPLTLSPQFELRDVHYTVTLTSEEL